MFCFLLLVVSLVLSTCLLSFNTFGVFVKILQGFLRSLFSGFSLQKTAFFSVFCFILVANLLGLLPFGFCLRRQVWFRVWLALCFFFVCVSIMFLRGLVFFVGHFVPSGAPLFLGLFLFFIEVVSMFIRPLTLTLRLCANMTAGHVLLGLLSGLTSSLLLTKSYFLFSLFLALGVGFFFFELAVCFIQAIVFFLLLNSYISEAE